MPDRGGMVTPASSSRSQEDVTEDRAQPPIRWPHPTLAHAGLVALWGVGVFVAIFVPAFIVSPGARTAPSGDVWLAFGTTVVGAGIMILAASLLWRRTRDVAYFVMGAVPAFAGLAGGAIFAAAKLSGT
jgi:hypothetical protein